ncbi:phosphate ABC transporter substrate-binding protein PstS [Streptomyces sp. ISL-12]|uniref:phosphate ABC transporter substrate-binding protein PstS n=1 Tax=Streptomyces sp. ISL-12 TaxID=2819177 RepID=UPI001BE59011|nr:phosphate ABC transporter substrate-binding protein PstS [Streptomyces sp. ISL-12]MBT2412805.1 phosphate ABC transporter substrate-binding protein PstS [Streptomyces sp. ISL-12]
MKPATRFRLAATVLSLLCALLAVNTPPAAAASYAKITGSGSTWSSNAVQQWIRNVKANYGMTVNFTANGSSQGREQFKNNTVDFAVSEIPYGLKEQGITDQPPKRGYAYMPIVAGGTAFMYNLKINGKMVTNLRMSGATVAKIFTGAITRWNDPAIRADNPGLTLPARAIVPVVRSDGSGTSAQFTTWMSKEHGSLWSNYCSRTGRGSGNCGMTSNYPLLSGSAMVSKSGSLGVSGHVRQASGEGAITYVEYSYAKNTGFPVAKVLNKADYYVEPTAASVAVALTKAQINDNKKSVNYLTQILDGVYDNADDRTYPLSSYSYMILPTAVEAGFTKDKGNSLGTFSRYFLCDGQQQAEDLGYSPLPKNLVQAGFDQIRKVPGAPTGSIDINECRNPTFSGGTNTLIQNAPHPKSCDKKGATQCTDGTAGAAGTDTPVKPGAQGGNGSGGGSGSGDGDGSGSGGSGSGSGDGDGSGSGADADGDGTPDAEESAAADGSGSGGVIDPDTGEVIGAGAGTGDSSVVANPVSLASADAFGMRGALMALSAVLLVAVVVGPPLTARALAARTRRRGEGR